MFLRSVRPVVLGVVSGSASAARWFARAGGFAALGIALAASAPVGARSTTPLPSVALKEPTPDFAFDLGGGPQRLRDLVGRPVVLSFWATWCRPCLDELPTLVRVQQTYGDRISLITLSSEGHDVARSYLLSQNISLPLVEDPTKRIFDAYSVDDIPVMIVLDGNGRASYVSVGETTWDDISGAIETVLKTSQQSSNGGKAPEIGAPA